MVTDNMLKLSVLQTPGLGCKQNKKKMRKRQGKMNVTQIKEWKDELLLGNKHKYSEWQINVRQALTSEIGAQKSFFWGKSLTNVHLSLPQMFKIYIAKINISLKNTSPVTAASPWIVIKQSHSWTTFPTTKSTHTVSETNRLPFCNHFSGAAYDFSEEKLE